MNNLKEGIVDTGKEYFELTYGSVQVETPKFDKVALLGRINDQEFIYQFFDQATDEIKKCVLHDLRFYLIEHGSDSFMKNAWEYAKYHATTSSNVYSPVHWNFYPIK